ncbi:hypothetical protein LNKW23_18900 [Paralimibaculum aggregatum]|uniref:histidine kinase n=1 Tax=Paralimibaculum aggregatum TaxID=3036245 RepID=A0ABQ6LI61_9RHOB|nr:ATP-binding protein [Limibaculum sp. NKW23]GMG82677.1 hypothetical protein LNKW23_18900 [Limibaculum sp. NKW23]
MKTPSDPHDTPRETLPAAIRSVPVVTPADVVLRLRTAIWVFDFDTMRIVWANPAALKLWDAGSVEALVRRDMRSEMSNSVKTRLEQHQEDFTRYPDREISELWTLYPEDRPVRVQAILRRHELEPGRFGMLVEARPEEVSAPETIRSADALLHAQTIIALFDQSGRALYGNPAFRTTFGPGEQVFGREFASPADLLECFDGLKRHGEHRMTTLVHTRHGKRWLDIHAIRCKDAVTGDGAFHVNMLDVTEAREHAQELAEARDMAERAVRARSQFLAVMSHELRTPLNGILGMVNLLQNSRIAGEQKGMLDVIGQSGELMLDLVGNILHLVEIESGGLSVRAEEFDPVLLMDAVVEAAKEANNCRELTVLSSSHFDGPTLFRHDPDLIKQVLRVLIDNAVKFTERGFVSVRVGASASGTGLLFEVADTGPGIPAEDIERIFNCFFQGDSSSTRRVGGTGIGLAIAQAIVAQWDGVIEVRSELGRGSIFSFEVPAMRVSMIGPGEGDPGSGGGPGYDPGPGSGRGPHLKVVSP